MSFEWPVSQGYVVGQTIRYIRDRQWWEIWGDRIRQFKWDVPKTEPAEWRVIATSDGDSLSDYSGNVMKRKQWEWHPRGWFILLTVHGPWGLGFMVTGGLRYNGVDIYMGPAVLTVQPPTPE